MSKRARTLLLGVTLAAINLTGLTAVAQADTNDDISSKRHRALGQAQLGVAVDHDTPRPPRERQPGEPYRYYHDALAAQAQAALDDARRPPTEGQVGESWHPPAKAPVQPVEPSGQPDWLIPAIGVLAALVLCGGLAVTTTRRARRRVRVGHAA
jgi:ABC-type amino acid transport substrate-binding protein